MESKIIQERITAGQEAERAKIKAGSLSEVLLIVDNETLAGNSFGLKASRLRERFMCAFCFAG